jgi:hypothetical protein
MRRDRRITANPRIPKRPVAWRRPARARRLAPACTCTTPQLNQNSSSLQQTGCRTAQAPGQCSLCETLAKVHRMGMHSLMLCGTRKLEPQLTAAQ